MGGYIIKGQASNREIGVASAIMIVLLLYLYLTAPHTPPNIEQTSNKCELRGNFSCYQQPVLNRNGSLEILLEQDTGELINITSFVCTSKSGLPAVMPFLDKTVLLTPQERAYISGGNSGNSVVCTGQDGRSIPNASVGDVYYGNVYIGYSEVKTGAFKVVNGTLVVKYS